jgi:uncharacterized caspase-like protein/formylglycine-generating enzyme required for sulfatase activity
MKLLIVLLAAWLGIASAAEPQHNLGIAAPTSAEKRVALVIGNAAYKSGPLANPVNDARAIANRLRSLGFDIVLRENLKQREIGGVYREFRSKITPGGVAMVFYAGHGVQFKGQNYFPATDADISSEEDVPLQSLNLGNLLDNMEEAKAGVSLVFLDACRDNPFARRFRSASRGLAKVEAASGTLIHYATRPGSVASDGEGKNGTYTEALLGQMSEPGVPVELMLKRVANNVVAKTKGKQEPWVEGSLRGDFYFRSVAGATSGVAPQHAVPVDLTAVEISFWESIKSSTDSEDFQSYLNRFPNGQFVELAERRLKRKPAKADQTAPTAVPGTIIKDCADCPEMVSIPEKRFAIGRTEVTQRQWKAVMGNNPSSFRNCGDDCPVENVTWNDTQEFIQKLNAKTSKQYRLPSDEEWEYACYGSSQTAYCGSNDLNAVAWTGGNRFSGSTHPTATKQANSLGVFDMSGNVWEWTGDCWQGDCSQRVIRGGSWGHALDVARLGNRFHVGMTERDNDVGFRLVRKLGQESTQAIETPRPEASKSRRSGAANDLEWAESDNGADINWHEAKQYCADKGSGWRLPSMAELQENYQTGQPTPCGTVLLFGTYTCKVASKSRLTGPVFWSNEPNGSSEAWYMLLDTGVQHANPMKDRTERRALCARQP